MRNNGFYASMEALLSLLLLAAMLLTVREAKGPSLENLYILQKENDLLKLWAKEGIPAGEEMTGDFELAFPGRGGEIRVNDIIIPIGDSSKEAVSSEILFIDSHLNKTKVVLAVFK